MTTRYCGHLDRINNVILAAVGLQALNHHVSDRPLRLSLVLTYPEMSFRKASLRQDGDLPKHAQRSWLKCRSLTSKARVATRSHYLRGDVDWLLRCCCGRSGDPVRASCWHQ
jgi:hypothetical protein